MEHAQRVIFDVFDFVTTILRKSSKEVKINFKGVGHIQVSNKEIKFISDGKV